MDQRPLSAREGWLLLLILVISLLLRLTALDAFLTPDEPVWEVRSAYFSDALLQRDWASTYQTGHPGVVTMWLGAASCRFPLLQAIIACASALLRPLAPAVSFPSGLGVPSATVAARGLVGLVTWLGLVALYPLLARLFDRHTALLAVGLVAFDPFYLGQSRLHHLDGLLTAFVTLSVVLLAVYRLREQRLGYLLASAAMAALATANKSPGVLLLPWAGVVLFLPALRTSGYKRKQALRQGLRDMALWMLAAVAVFVVMWPATWVDPLGTVSRVFGTARYYVETAHEDLNFFWFAVRPDPGPLFYPVAWAFRTTPFVLLGLLALLFVRRKQGQWETLGLLALASALFWAAMTVGEKKFDRYLLPVFPLLDIVAAVGWVALYRRIEPVLRSPSWLPAVLTGVLIAGQCTILWPTRPYYLSYYNPLLGGGQTAAQVLLTGWGEGLERAAAYLNAKPAAEDLLVGTTNLYAFQPFFRGQALRLRELPSLAEADYFVIYISNAQRGLPPEVSDLLSGQEAESVVVHNGIEYARIYANPLRRNVEEALTQIGAQGDADRDLILLDADAALSRRYRGAVPLRKLADSEREDVLLSALYDLSLQYPRLWRLCYPGQPAISLAVTSHLQRVAEVGRRIVVGEVQAVRYDLSEMVRGELLEPPVECDVHFGDSLVLRGYDIAPAVLAPGDSLRVRLYWHCEEPVSVSYTAFVQLVDAQNTMRGQLDSLPQGGYRPTNTWSPGETFPDDHTLQVAADAPPGEYTLLIGLYELATMERLPASDAVEQALADNAWHVTGIRVTAGQSP